MQASLKNLTQQLQDPVKAVIALVVVAILGFFLFKRMREGNQNQDAESGTVHKKKPPAKVVHK